MSIGLTIAPRHWLLIVLCLGVITANVYTCRFDYRPPTYLGAAHPMEKHLTAQSNERQKRMFARMQDNRGSQTLPLWLSIAILAWLFIALLPRYRWRLIPLLILLLPLAAEAGFRYWVKHGISAQDYANRVAAFHDHGNAYTSALHEPSPYVGYRPKANLDLPNGRKHNNLGFRDHRDLGPEHDSLRLVFIGGSTTYGGDLPDNQDTFTYRLEQALNSEYADKLNGRAIEVVNAGLAAATSAENLSRLIFLVSEIAPDLVVIHHGLSETWTRAYGGPIQSDFSNYRTLWHVDTGLCGGRPVMHGLSEVLTVHSRLFHWLAGSAGMARVKGVVSVNHANTGGCRGDCSRGLAENDTGYFERNTRYMVSIAEAMGAGVVIASISPPVATQTRPEGVYGIGVPQQNRAMQRVADAEGVPFFDFAAVMPMDMEHIVLDKHVNEVGAQKKADLFQAFFRERGVIDGLLSGEADAMPREPESSP